MHMCALYSPYFLYLQDVLLQVKLTPALHPPWGVYWQKLQSDEEWMRKKYSTLFSSWCALETTQVGC
jgi:hypothetical protein